jgi:hypothetical protein
MLKGKLNVEERRVKDMCTQREREKKERSKSTVIHR